MSNLEIKSWNIKTAKLGPNNPLPALFPNRTQPQIKVANDIPQEISKQMERGHVPSILPYAVQDDYSRTLHTTETTVAVLENEILRATFLLDMGGRLWSLYHKPTQRELLEVNPAVHAANLGIRNAWFSGGAEWNIGTLGHSPFSYDPVFAARILRDDGIETLRLYEWERFREVPFQIDASLPPGSPVLFLNVRIINPHDTDVPMYWWSNIAVPETNQTRVICPAETAYCLGIEPNRLVKKTLPTSQGMDLSYPKNYPWAADIFFEVKEHNRPWITALERDGTGLFHISSDNLPGLKMWVWGTGNGGKNWQRFLSPPGKGYLEIQAGLTKTQLEHLIMPGDSEISWMEAIGLISVDPHLAQSANWLDICDTVQAELDQVIPPAVFDQECARAVYHQDCPPSEIIQRGSGWGSLENLRRKIDHQPPCFPAGLVFDKEGLGEEQLPWVQLLQQGLMPTPAADQPPTGFLVGEVWRQKIQQAVAKNLNENWLAWYHLGLMNYFAGDYQQARSAWLQSSGLVRNPWAIRNIAMIHWKDDQLEKAAELLVEAHSLAPSILQLTIELGKCMIEAGQSDLWLDVVQQLPPAHQTNGRIRLLEAQAALAEKNIGIIKRFFDDKICPPDLREGENSLTELWYAYQALRITRDRIPAGDQDKGAQLKIEFPVPEFADFQLSEQ